MINLIRNTINSFRAVFGNAAANAFIQATGITGSVQKAAITQLCIDLQASGLWSKMKAVYPMVTDNRNLFSYSEDFTNSVWIPANVTISANTSTSPIGTNNADSFNSAATSNPHPLICLYSTSGTITYSIYVKKNNSRYVSIKNVGGSANWAGAIFDLDNLVVTKTDSLTQTNISASIQDAGNGWRRISITSTGTFTDFSIQYAPNGTSSFSTYGDIVSTGTGSTDYFIWGAQLEQSSTATTYQPILTTPSAFMASQMKYNLKDARDLDAAFRLTWSGGWTYSATGATPNGTNAYVDTKLVPSTNLAFNSISFSVYSRTDFTPSANQTVGCTSNSANALPLIGMTLGANKYLYSSVYSYNAPDTLSSNSAQILSGLVITSRTAANSFKLYKNSTIVASATTNSQTTQPTNSFIFGAFKNVNTIQDYCSYQYGFAHISDGLTDQDVQLFNQIVEKYQVALSRGVQAAQSFYYNSAYSNEANTYLYSTQITGTTQVSAINTLINGLKANNLWSKMKAVYPFVTDKTLQSDMAAQMKFNLVNPQDSDSAFRLAFSGGWTYSTNGAQPNGTNGYADTKLFPSAVLGQFSSHLSFYSRTDYPVTGYYTPIGTDTGSNLMRLRILDVNSPKSFAIMNSVATWAISNAVTNSLGFYIGTRTSNNKLILQKNNTILTTSTVLEIGGLPNNNMTIGALKSGGAMAEYSNYQAAFASIGDGLTDSEAALLYQLVQDFQTTLSRQV